MKQSNVITKVIVFVLLAAVLLALGTYTIQSLTNSMTTTMAYQDAVDESVELTGVVVRQEQALASSGQVAAVQLDEGEHIAVGQAVAVLYQDGTILEVQEQLGELEQEREQLQHILDNESVGTATQLERQILQSVLTLRSDAVKGTLSALETNTQSLRTLILQMEFIYAPEDSTALLTAAIQELDEQIAQLETTTTNGMTSIYTPCAGLYFTMVDGLEGTLTPETVMSMTAEDVKELTSKTILVDTSSVGKVISGDRWYFAAVTDAETAAKLTVGDAVTTVFSRDYSGEASMQVERLEHQEDGSYLLVLSSNLHLKEIAMLRIQTVDLILQRSTGIRIPKQALRTEMLESTDAETGEIIQTRTVGVYTVVGAQAQFNPVDIIAEGSDSFLVTPSESASSSNALRAGDEVIVTATDLYDGKVVIG